jgi:NitT/TauT family transport system ATP-binding protein
VAISLDGVTKIFTRRGRQVRALDPVSLEIETGSFVALVGPSGCGKSTLLNMIAGIVPRSAGRIRHDGRDIDGLNRAVGYLTQADSLLPWRTAEENVMLPLVLRGESRATCQARARALLETVDLTGFGAAYPAELSGGMRKRVALAQVLCYDPDTLLMDEPFGALDAQLKLVMQQQVVRLWGAPGDTAGGAARKTVVLVTHDLGEAIALADQVVVFSGRPGRIKTVHQIDIERPRDVFRIRFDPRFLALNEAIWHELAPEIAKGEAL